VAGAQRTTVRALVTAGEGGELISGARRSMASQAAFMEAKYSRVDSNVYYRVFVGGVAAVAWNTSKSPYC